MWRSMHIGLNLQTDQLLEVDALDRLPTVTANMSQAPDSEWPQYRTNVSYSNKSRLNNLEWCIPEPTSDRDSKRLWIVYIHGGAWRDPEINAASFNGTRDLLMASSVAEHIAGYASINYRLSPYPSHSRHPSNPDDAARNAHHPDHIRDVLAAILHLQETFRFQHRYLLVGHSCGATLALQVAMKRMWTDVSGRLEGWETRVVPPTAILGVEGLYDLPALVQYHRDQAVYRELVVNAFGSDETAWQDASPAHDLFDDWPTGRLVVLAHSHQDELVEWEQVTLQHDALRRQGWSEDGPRRVMVLEVQGQHDEVWRKATELARAVQVTVQLVVDQCLT